MGQLVNMPVDQCANKAIISLANNALAHCRISKLKKNMKYVVTKEFRFEAAHRLLKNYCGKCTNNHGHSWLVTLHLEGSKLDDKDMLIDFQEMKTLKTWIDDHLDHATLLWAEDPMCDYIRESKQRLFITAQNPTSEHIAEIILEEAIRLFNNSRIKVSCVEVNETCTTGAKIYPE